MQTEQEPTIDTDQPTPKALRYADRIDALEEKMLNALPAIFDKLIEDAKAGDKRAAFYLIERIMGRLPKLPTPPSQDRSLPYTKGNLEIDRGYETRKLSSFRTDQERIMKQRAAPAFVT